MTLKNAYKIIYSNSSKNDVKEIRRYIIDTFKYRELGKNFTQKVKKALKELKAFDKASNINHFRRKQPVKADVQ